jgi:hypothetical protein
MRVYDDVVRLVVFRLCAANATAADFRHPPESNCMTAFALQEFDAATADRPRAPRDAVAAIEVEIGVDVVEDLAPLL